MDCKFITKSIYWELFKSTFLISMFTFGGGFVIIPLMKERFVDQYNWLEERETMNLIAIAQSAPGAVAINASIILGYKIAGIRGIISTLFGTVLPPLIILTIVSKFYVLISGNLQVQFILKGMQCGVAIVLANIVFKMILKELKHNAMISSIIMVGSFLAAYLFNVNILLILLIDAIIGIVFLKEVNGVQ